MNRQSFIYIFIIVSLIGIFMTPVHSYAQRQIVQNLPRYDQKKYHFGFTLGFTNMDFRVLPTKDLLDLDSLFAVEPQNQYGFNIGIVSSMRLYEYLDLRFVPTLTFGDRTLEYSLRYQDTLRYVNKKHIESTLIDLPLTLKYKSKRINNYRAYVLGGVRYSIDLASQAEKKQAVSQDVIVKLKRNDIAGEIGVGFDFFLNYFKFGTEIKMAYGVRDLLQREKNIYTKGIDKLQSKILWITFTFE